MNPSASAVPLAVLAGALLAAQAPANAMLARAAGSPAAAAWVSFLVGWAALSLVLTAAPVRADPAALRALPWFAWGGGLLGAFAVAVGAFAAPRLGLGALLAAILVGQMAAAAAIDHFGALGLARQPLSAARLAGLVLLALGAVLVRRS